MHEYFREKVYENLHFLPLEQEKKYNNHDFPEILFREMELIKGRRPFSKSEPKRPRRLLELQPWTTPKISFHPDHNPSNL